MRPRVLLLSTPLDARTHLDGARLAVVELATALARIGAARPTVLITPGTAPPAGCEGLAIERTGLARTLEVIARASRVEVDLIHALFAPRDTTAAGLALLRRARRCKIVQTIASVPSTYSTRALVGDVVVSTSESTATRVRALGLSTSVVPMPFAAASIPTEEVDAPRDAFLYAGDWEFGDGIEPALEAMATMAPPVGAKPVLLIASRAKTRKAQTVERALRERLATDEHLRTRVRILGEVPTLLPYLARARAVVLPVSSTYAKLDHPRVLLEAIALGTRVIVGDAPSLRELVVAPSIGEVTANVSQLREAMEAAWEAPRPSPSAVLRILEPRRPEVVADAYSTIHRTLLAR